MDGCHGNNEIHMHTKFHIVWCASLRSEEVVIGKVPEAIFVNGCHGNA